MKRQSKLDRRAMLRGAGAMIALPLLDQMALGKPTGLAAAAATGDAGSAPVRLAWVFAPNGVNVAEWRGGEADNRKGLSPTLKPLAGLEDEVLVIDGLAQVNARPHGDGPGDHARSSACFLTGARPIKTTGAGMRVGVSVDQVAASHLGGQTLLPSLELGIDPARAAGVCDSGYACAYISNISWRSPTQPTTKEISPRLAFERLFGAPGAAGGQGNARSADGEAARRRIARRQSVLDMVADQARTLHKRLGRSDRTKLDEYFHSVRDVERRVELLADAALAARRRGLLEGVTPPPDEAPEDVGAHIRSMGDLIVLAFRTDTTRVATLMLANEGSGRKYSVVGVEDAHHQLSHHRNKPEQLDKIARIDRYLIEQYAYVLRRMKATPERDGTLLDNSLILYGSAISDGNRHHHHDLPIVVAGRGGGAFAPGRRVQASHETPLCNLYLSMLAAAGVDEPRFGDSTGPLKSVSA